MTQGDYSKQIEALGAWLDSDTVVYDKIYGEYNGVIALKCGECY